MSLLTKAPRAVRRTVIRLALKDPANVPGIRADLASLKASKTKTERLLDLMAQTIHDTEAELRSISA